MSLIYGMVKDNIFTCNNSNAYTYKKNTYKIAYDGNIYSSVIIKQELLSKGYYFETCLEEEIVLKAFIEYGFEAYNKFSGHFAIVIWNECNKELFFLRDYYSIKSLYYKTSDNGDIVFSNNLLELLNSTKNVISYDRFVDSYLTNFNIKEGFVTETIKESTKIMFCEDKVVSEVENISHSEYGYIFDEVAQIVLSNLDDICIVRLEDKNNEINIVAEYILKMLEKEKRVVSKVFSRKKLNWFLNNMSLPFYNLAEYNLVFTNVKCFGLLDLEINEIKRFYNIDFFCKEYSIKLALPRFCREKILGINEVYLPICEIAQSSCRDEEFVYKKFKEVIKQKSILINPLKLNECNYYMVIYFIRLNNWIKKYNIKII